MSNVLFILIQSILPVKDSEFSLSTTAEFLNFGVTKILGQIILGSCPVLPDI